MTASAMGVVLATPAYAQQAADPGGNDIVVTARRIEERLQDVPISMTVYTPEQLSNRNIINSTDIATYTPSLTVNSRYGPDKSSFAIRGFSQDLNTLPSVGVYFAEVVAPRLNSNITSGNGAGVGSMFDLQNVQVLKGPQGTLFGRNTTGGAILLVPNRPTDRFEGYVEGTYGNYDATRVQMVLNVPLADTFKVRLGFDRYKRDGYLHNRSGIGPSDFNDINYFAARLSILADLTPDLENYLIATYAKSDTNGFVGKIGACNRNGIGTTRDGNISATTAAFRLANCAELDRQAANNFGFYDVMGTNPNPYIDSRTWQVINTTTWQASDTFAVKNIVSYGEAREKYSFNLNGDWQRIGNTIIPFITTNAGITGPQGRQWSLTEEFQLRGNSGDDRLSWQAGFYYEKSNPLGPQEQWTSIFANCTNVYSFQCTPYSILGGTFAIGNVSVARNDYFFDNKAVYAQGTYNFTEQLALTLGGRWTWDKVRTTGDGYGTGNGLTNGSAVSPSGLTVFRGFANQLRCSQAPTPTDPIVRANLATNKACFREFTQSSDKPTWTIDFDYKPNDDILAYGKYSRGYRGGGVNQSNVGNETWNPEKVDTFEVGVKTSFHGALHGSFNLTGFYNDFQDQQVSVFITACTAGVPGCTNPAPVGINGIQNVGKSTIKGIEADLVLEPFEGFRLDAGYAYLDAKVKESNVPACDPTRYACVDAAYLLPGNELFFAPKNRITVTGTYTLPLDESIGRISLGATFVHTDAQYANHSSDHAFSIGAIPFNTSHLPATDLLTLNLNWTNVAGAPIDLALFATNVTDEKYWVATANGLSSLGADFLILGEPRMYGLRLKYRFGE
jgi:iron complex outermembrane receptor protein